MKDLLSTRPFVLKEVQAGNDLLESWKKTAEVYKGRSVAENTLCGHQHVARNRCLGELVPHRQATELPELHDR